MRIHYKKENFCYSLPKGFLHPTQSEKYLKASFSSPITLVQNDTALGALCDFGFCKIEYYTGEEEPKSSKQKGFGLQIWHQVSNKKRRASWIALPKFLRRSTTALLDLTGSSREYWIDWSEQARRQRKKWHLQKDLYINEATKDEFVEAYKKGTLASSLKELFLHSIERHVETYKDDVHFLVVREKDTQAIIAGFMTVDDFVTKQSFYPVAFIQEKAKRKPASVGLMDYWIQQSKKKNLLYINLGIVWMFGDPPSWKGYSQFKSFFHPKILVFQRPYIRFFWNR